MTNRPANSIRFQRSASPKKSRNLTIRFTPQVWSYRMIAIWRLGLPTESRCWRKVVLSPSEPPAKSSATLTLCATICERQYNPTVGNFRTFADALFGPWSSIIKQAMHISLNTKRMTTRFACSAARFAPTPLGRAILHLECLCHHPAAARFYFDGLKRNLRESAASAQQSTSKLLRNALSHCMK